MLDKLALLLTITLISCTSTGAVEMQNAASGDAVEIKYLSLDHYNAFVFSDRTARSGSIEAYALPAAIAPYPSSPIRTFRTADNVHCVSVGSPGNTTEFAIRRPIRAGDRYTCLGSSFEVSHCTDDCRSAIVRVERAREPDIGPLRSQMYVDSCRGVLTFSDTGDLLEGIPLDAPLLRGPVGILADPNYPECDWY